MKTARRAGEGGTNTEDEAGRDVFESMVIVNGPCDRDPDREYDR